MSIKLTMKERAALVNRNLEARPADPNEPPRTVPGNTFRFGAEAAELKAQVAQLEEKLATAGQGTKRVPMSRLHKVPGRQRQLSPEDYAELRENLRSNGLIDSLTVEVRQDEDWDIVSGNNRYDIGLELGWEDVAIYEAEIESGKGDVIAFYANLIKSTLSDFEKYQGIKTRMQATGMTHSEMAEESGLSKQLVSSLMAFDKLPDEAIAALEKNKKCLGAKAAERFAKLTEEGRGEQVTKAIVNLSEDAKLTQEKAIASAEPKIASAIKETVKPNIHKIGKSNFAEVRGVDKVLRISFANATDRVELEDAINSLIDNHIQSKKK